MIAVAVAGVAIGGVTLEMRRVHYRNQALKHEVLEILFRDGHVHFGRDPGRSAYHAAMMNKYQNAAAHPRLAVEPDPPGPVTLRKLEE